MKTRLLNKHPYFFVATLLKSSPCTPHTSNAHGILDATPLFYKAQLGVASPYWVRPLRVIRSGKRPILWRCQRPRPYPQVTLGAYPSRSSHHPPFPIEPAYGNDMSEITLAEKFVKFWSSGRETLQVVVSNIFLIFTPIWGRFPFRRSYFSIGLKPPTN